MIASTLICSASVSLVTANHIYCYNDGSSWNSHNFYLNRDGISATAAFGFINAILYFIGAIFANQPENTTTKLNKTIKESPKIQNNENFYGYETIPRIEKDNKNIANYL